ncbi:MULTISPECIES: ABC transporter substrate-binding protein [unclassified Mycolicibacterium]|uniref:substrate-binding periplasmic protein n=1 Tax=unclassified Mycolicibacterium TaxID=2636767 RepID=UPI00130B5AAA|nr:MULTISPECIES: ABC transporter substrate-binding protein [unclassified Mycolicibacterium]MUL81293.1 amino acid ABC transporter substrate-binding protein [Mycolicibacterium sp. CBMA 329]MUL87059.1 amino acid ABC transporter substrate-binding protein [Mycolicibacterium sp. CBMA 331]MUL98658.1 amino acid ABC transporter substrate-binding protein [Mycolicibacterium sp. CBMA 334]MUM28491.1 amino acid ABC transporter substrate-binding protein [Mycolicibacterium sp. CBMA 295]MUM37356.1 amino acid A
MTGPLRLACIDADAPPLFGLASAPGGRAGYEPSVGELLAAELDRELEWVIMPWGDMLPAASAHQVDGVLCGQGIIPARLEQADFTRPYGIFHEGILMRRGEAVPDSSGLAGKRIAAIRASANYNLASSFTGAEVVEFESEHVYEDMLAALRSGEVDAVCDDDVVFVPLGDSDPDFELAFVVKTNNPWGIAVAKDRPETLAALDGALARIIADGRLKSTWAQWLPTLDYPFEVS